MLLKNLLLHVAYDGTNYLGWQLTKEGPSIEGCLKNVIEQILQHSVQLQAASRTDAGVHAKNQTVNFFVEKEFCAKRLFISLNQLLPKDIRVLELKDVPLDFHPTLHCKGKTYTYQICCGKVQLPCHRHYSWHVIEILDVPLMKAALPSFIGSHDFSAFCNMRKNLNYEHYIRNVESFELTEFEDNRLVFRISGNNFLYKMVRNLVGTVVDIGRNRLKIEDIPDIINQKSRIKAGITAPAHGLCLEFIHY